MLIGVCAEHIFCIYIYIYIISVIVYRITTVICNTISANKFTWNVLIIVLTLYATINSGLHSMVKKCSQMFKSNYEHFQINIIIQNNFIVRCDVSQITRLWFVCFLIQSFITFQQFIKKYCLVRNYYYIYYIRLYLPNSTSSISMS